MSIQTVKRILRQQPGEFFCLAYKSNGRLKEEWFKRSELNDMDSWVQSHKKYDLYFSPMGFSAKHRQEKSTILPSLCWADLDEVDPTKIEPKPTVAWESSPGRYAALWRLDEELNNVSVNRALNEAVCPDSKSSFIVGKLLRIPGTTNYKPEYGDGVPGKLLWDNGPTYELDRFERKFKSSAKTKTVEGGELDAAELFEQYQKAIKPEIRRYIAERRPQKSGKRSEVLWKVWHGLFDAGLTIEESVCVVQGTVWNKWSGRRNEEDQLYREAQKVLEERVEGRAKKQSSSKNKGDDDFAHMFTAMRDVVAKPVDWIIPGWLSRKNITILEGDPGIGKSNVLISWAIHICDAKQFHMSRRKYQKKLRPQVVILFDAENDPETVNKPRVVDNGLENDHLLLQVNTEIIDLDDEDRVDYLDQFIEYVNESIGDVALLAFDTINNYMGQGDTHKASDVQQTLNSLTMLARKHDIGVLLLRHLTKGGKDKIQYRGQGSIAFMGAARQVHTMAQHPREEDILVVKTTKSNIGIPEKPLTLELKQLPGMAGRDERSKVVILGHDESVTDNDLNSPKKDEKEAANRKDSGKRLIEFLRQELRKAMSKSRLYTRTEAQGWTKRDVDKALSEVGAEEYRYKGEIWAVIEPD